MKKSLALIFLVFIWVSSNVYAQEQSHPTNEKQGEKKEEKVSSYNGPIFDLQVMLGAGGSISKGGRGKNGTFNFGFGVMLVRPIKHYKHLHVVGFGRRYDLYDGYSETLSRHDTVYTSINTFIPIKFGPITLEYSWSKVESLRRDRGRVFMIDINTDIFDDFKRLVREGKIQIQ